MKNKKGITIVEMLVSLALISIVLGFLLQLLLQLRDLDDKSLSKLEYEEKIAVAVNYIQDRIKDEKDCQFNNYGNNFTITCSEPYPVELKVEKIDDRSIQVTNNSTAIAGENKVETFTFPEGCTISNLDITNNATAKLTVYSYNILDDKNNNYLLEISYVNK